MFFSTKFTSQNPLILSSERKNSKTDAEQSIDIYFSLFIYSKYIITHCTYSFYITNFFFDKYHHFGGLESSQVNVARSQKWIQITEPQFRVRLSSFALEPMTVWHYTMCCLSCDGSSFRELSRCFRGTSGRFGLLCLSNRNPLMPTDREAR